MTNSRRKVSWKIYNYKRYWLKSWKFNKKDDFIGLDYIKKILEKSNDKLVLSKRIIRRYLKKGYTHDMQLEKHELTQKQKDNRLRFCKEYIDHDFCQTVFINETLFWVGKANQIKWKK